MLKEKLNKIREYFIGMEMYDGRWVVRVKYRPKWGAYPPENGTIKVVADDGESDVWWYCAESPDVDIDTIIDLIDETIQTNMEAIKKVELFKLKASELKKIFSDEKISFKKLQKLRFVFDDTPVTNPVQQETKPEPRKKVASKKELITQVDEAIKEHDVFSTPQPEKIEVEAPTPKKNTKRKKAEVVEETIHEGITADSMSQEEIDDLRG